MSSYMRVLHASPNAPPVDVYANGNIIAQNLAYRNFTEYISVAPGTYNIQVYPAGTRKNPVIDTTLAIPDQSIFTVAAVGRLPDIDLLPVSDKAMYLPAGKAYIKFAHLSPNAPQVDVTLPDGTVLFKNVGYKEITNYLAVNPGTYTLQARVAGTGNVVLTVPNQVLKANKYYTAYAVGLVGETPPLQLLTPLDGATYLPV